jgi:hypothetical protein
MAQSSRPSITKRQKELSRMEKRKEKEERRLRRKEEKAGLPSAGGVPDAGDVTGEVAPALPPDGRDEDPR